MPTRATRRWRRRTCAARRDAPDRGEPALGAGLASARRSRRSPGGARRTPRGSRPDAIAAEDVAINRAIGEHGAALIAVRIAAARRPVQVMTHCNAGWLATVDYGTALAAIYQRIEAGVPLHVWVGETRPRMQGAADRVGARRSAASRTRCSSTARAAT